MGICASCLGLQRSPSQDNNETDPLLDDQHAQYGGVGGEEVSQPDEEELRRAREELEQITAEASDNMVDVLHPETADLHQRFAHYTTRHTLARLGDPFRTTPRAEPNENEEDDEDAWLESVQAAVGGDAAATKAVEHGGLLIDPSQLRVEATTSAGKKAYKGRLE